MQYLLNATAIWLLSLLLFDLLLKRESFHSYNRFYLLFTFTLGALLPLVQWQSSGLVRRSQLQQPIDTLITAKVHMADATAAAAPDIQLWLWAAHIAGAAVACALLIADVVKLAACYRSGHAWFEDGWRIIATGKDHAPFSFRKTLFINTRLQYTDEEWTMVLRHERRHTQLLHVADMLLMQAARIVFWFHPLVYIYNKRLLLVHEYQADAPSAGHPHAYGRFLVEQAMLQAAPGLSHSFNRSPIKNRIYMLTHQSSKVAKAKMLVFLPLAAVAVFCFTQNSFAQGFTRSGNVVTYKGNKFTLSAPVHDTIILSDPATGKEQTKIMTKEPYPIKMNGKDLPQKADRQAAYTGTDANLRAYIMRNLKKELAELKDGMYSININNILVDEKGRIVYFDYHDIRKSRAAGEIPANAGDVQMSIAPKSEVKVQIGAKQATVMKNNNPAYYEQIDQEQQEIIFRKVCKLIDNAPRYTPGVLNGKPVVTEAGDMVYFYNHFKVENHKLYDMINGTFVAL